MGKCVTSLEQGAVTIVTNNAEHIMVGDLIVGDPTSAVPCADDILFNADVIALAEVPLFFHGVCRTRILSGAASGKEDLHAAGELCICALLCAAVCHDLLETIFVIAAV